MNYTLHLHYMHFRENSIGHFWNTAFRRKVGWKRSNSNDLLLLQGGQAGIDDPESLCRALKYMYLSKLPNRSKLFKQQHFDGHMISTKKEKPCLLSFVTVNLQILKIMLYFKRVFAASRISLTHNLCSHI